MPVTNSMMCQYLTIPTILMALTTWFCQLYAQYHLSRACYETSPLLAACLLYPNSSSIIIHYAPQSYYPMLSKQLSSLTIYISNHIYTWAGFKPHFHSFSFSFSFSGRSTAMLRVLLNPQLRNHHSSPTSPHYIPHQASRLDQKIDPITNTVFSLIMN